MRANPGKVNYGTLGIASSQHLGMERIAAQAGVTWTHVPYRGTSEMLTALISGHIDAAGESSSWAPMVEEGRLRLLATWGSSRPPRFAQVPTLTELGIPHRGRGAIRPGRAARDGPRHRPSAA